MGNVLNNYVARYVILDVVRRDFDGGSFCFNRRHTLTDADGYRNARMLGSVCFVDLVY